MKIIRQQLALVPLIALALCGCDEKKVEAPVAPPVKVKIESISPQAVTESATLVGRLDSRKAVSLYPKVDGSISQIFVVPGQNVHAGQLLLEIDPTKQKAAVATKESEVLTAKADYQKEVARLESLKASREAQKASVDYDKTEYERNYWLEQRGVVSESTVDAYDRAYKVARAKMKEIDENIIAQQDVIKRAAQNIQSAIFSKKEQEEQLSYYRIMAPFAGVMADIPVKLGDYVNSQSKLTTVSQLRPLEVNVLVPKEMASGVRHGMPLEVLDDSGKRVAVCTVFHIDPIVDQQNQSVLVKALFDNADGHYRPDQSVTTSLLLNQQQGIMIPTEALSFVAGRAFAYVVSNGANGMMAQQRPLQISSLQGNMAAIKDGVAVGDRIVISGVQNLRDGSLITIE
jgi:multidrug efflux pump subunit AcrA (membrane-fusion protein)